MRRARVHHAARRRGGGVAARGTRAAAERVRRIGMLMRCAADDAECRAASRRSCKGLRSWAGRRPQSRIDIAWAAADPAAGARGRTGRARARRHRSAPAPSSALQQATRTIPIVFISVGDPVGAASSPAWRGRAATSPASSSSAASAASGWSAQGDRARLTRVAISCNPERLSTIRAAQGEAASRSRCELDCRSTRRDAPEIERAIRDFARAPDGGLICCRCFTRRLTAI